MLVGLGKNLCFKEDTNDKLFDISDVFFFMYAYKIGCGGLGFGLVVLYRGWCSVLIVLFWVLPELFKKSPPVVRIQLKKTGSSATWHMTLNAGFS